MIKKNIFPFTTIQYYTRPIELHRPATPTYSRRHLDIQYITYGFSTAKTQQLL